MSIFREYDIRGVYGDGLTEPMASAIGAAFGTLVVRAGGSTVSLGRDVRLSGPALHKALLSGILSTGLDVLDIGLCPTPALYFSLFHKRVDGGVMITASHNPSRYNGFKLSLGRHSLFGDDIQQIQAMVAREDFIRRPPGRHHLEKDFLTDYLNYFTTHFKSFHGKKVVMDCGNAAGALIAPKIFERLGCEVVPLYCEPDGRFPNHHPDPTVAENMADLIAHVRSFGADAGIAFDGDADRLGVVDETGTIIGGDMLTLFFAIDILLSHPEAKILSEVKASDIFYDEVSRRGGQAIMSKTGHSLMKAKMRETGALLAGEMSGHLFFADRHFGYDDAIYAGCRLLEILSRSHKPLSSYFKALPKRVSTPEIRVDCSDTHKFKVVERCRDHFSKQFKTIDIDGVRILFDGGWGLIRASNTQPALVLRFEADTPDLLDMIEKSIRTFLNQVMYTL